MKYLLSLSCLVFVLGVILMPVAVIVVEAQDAPENNQINATGTPLHSEPRESHQFTHLSNPAPFRRGRVSHLPPSTTAPA